MKPTKDNEKKLQEWQKLPELPIKKNIDVGEKGSVYNVIRVGFFMIELPEGTVPHPTITIQEQNKEKMYRLPLELNGWAFDNVALAHTGIKMFPSNVEFSNIQGRYNANIIS